MDAHQHLTGQAAGGLRDALQLDHGRVAELRKLGRPHGLRDVGSRDGILQARRGDDEELIADDSYQQHGVQSGHDDEGAEQRHWARPSLSRSEPRLRANRLRRIACALVRTHICLCTRARTCAYTSSYMDAVSYASRHYIMAPAHFSVHQPVYRSNHLCPSPSPSLTLSVSTRVLRRGQPHARGPESGHAPHEDPSTSDQSSGGSQSYSGEA